MSFNRLHAHMIFHFSMQSDFLCFSRTKSDEEIHCLILSSSTPMTNLDVEDISEEGDVNDPVSEVANSDGCETIATKKLCSSTDLADPKQESDMDIEEKEFKRREDSLSLQGQMESDRNVQPETVTEFWAGLMDEVNPGQSTIQADTDDSHHELHFRRERRLEEHNVARCFRGPRRGWRTVGSRGFYDRRSQTRESGEREFRGRGRGYRTQQNSRWRDRSTWRPEIRQDYPRSRRWEDAQIMYL